MTNKQINYSQPTTGLQSPHPPLLQLFELASHLLGICSTYTHYLWYTKSQRSQARIQQVLHRQPNCRLSQQLIYHYSYLFFLISKWGVDRSTLTSLIKLQNLLITCNIPTKYFHQIFISLFSLLIIVDICTNLYIYTSTHNTRFSMVRRASANSLTKLQLTECLLLLSPTTVRCSA